MRVLVLTHQKPPEDLTSRPLKDVAEWRTEYDVIKALGRLDHEVRVLSGLMGLSSIREVITEWQPNVACNLLEEFHGEGLYVPYVLGYLELMKVPFTGCNPSGLMLADSKQLMKKVLRYHRITAPDFALFERGRAVRRPKRLKFPLFVKSATAHGSAGIAQASLVSSDEKLAERVAFVHETIQTDAIAEEYIEGRELYAGVIGNRRLETFPIWEMVFRNMADGAAPIATAKVKWDRVYQKEYGITTHAARNLPDDLVRHITRLCKRVYRLLGLSGYARMDFRLTENGRLYLLEPNPNPDLAREEDFSESAKSAGLDYDPLVQRILNLGIRHYGQQPVAQSSDC